MRDILTPLPEIADRRHADAVLTDLPGGIPSATSALAGMIVLLLVATGAILWSAPWVQTSFGRGEVIALDPGDRVQEINALVPGRISRWFVTDGSLVSAGDRILEITDIDPRFVERLETERAAIVSRVNAARTAAETARIDLDRQRQLYEDGLSARKDYERAQIAYQDMRVREAEARAALNKADIGLSRQSSQVVHAPQDGRIVRIVAGNSATLINAGDPVATFAPEHVERAVQVFVSGLDAPLVQPGLPARIIFEGWPAVQFSGWPEAALGTFGGIVLSVDPVATTGNRFRVLIGPDPDDPWPADRYLRLGSQAQGFIQLGKVRLGYELWRRLNRFPPRPIDAPPAAADVASP